MSVPMVLGDITNKLKKEEEQASKPILSIDFDGVIHSYTSGWWGPDFIPDPPVPGALAFLQRAVDVFDVCVFSSRSHQEGGIKAMEKWIRYWAWKDGTLDGNWLNELRFPKYKPAAHISIDDRGFQFDGTFPHLKTLLDFKPWNKRQ